MVKVLAAAVILLVVFLFHQSNIAKRAKIDNERRALAGTIYTLDSDIRRREANARSTIDTAVRKYQYMQNLEQKAEWIVATCRSEGRGFTPSEAVRFQRILNDYSSCTQYLVAADTRVNQEFQELQSLHSQRNSLISRYNSLSLALGDGDKAISESESALGTAGQNVLEQCVENAPKILRKLKIHL